jgi:GT2 family glycosyltransferase
MISVVIPNWNGEKYLPACLLSLRRQSYGDIEVILVDNGSDDRSVQLVRESFPDVRVIRFSRNRGFSAAVNAGIRVTKGDYVALLNNDTEADPRWLEELKKGLDTRGDVGFCASKILYFDRRSIINSAGDAMSVTGYPRCIGNTEPDSKEFERTREVFGASATAALYRKEMLYQVGMFDEDYFAYYEDVDLSFRGQLAGFRCLYIPTAVVYHWGSATTGEFSDFVVFHLERNVLYNLIKDMPLPIIRQNLKGIIKTHIGMGAVFASRRQFTVWARAKVSALAGLGRMVRKRREIDGIRRVSLEYIFHLLETS